MTDVEQALRDDLAADRPTEEGWQALAARADELGLVDVAYTTVDSPLGPLLVAATSKGVVRVSYGDEGIEATLADLARRVSPRLLELPRRLEPARRELDEYFAGRRRSFAVALDLRLVSGFRRKVLAATAQIPYGRTATYREVAARAGSERAVRAAGSALGANPVPILVPCHRVVRTGGGLGGYTGGLDRKAELLRREAAPA